MERLITLKEAKRFLGVSIKTPQEELVQDLITIISHFSGKLYGLRSHKTKKIVSAVKTLIKEKEERSTEVNKEKLEEPYSLNT